MIFEKVDFKKIFPDIKYSGYIRIYAPENFDEFSKNIKRKAVIVFPGGAYEFVSDREAEPVALNLLAEDFVVFVVNYVTGDFIHPYPLLQAILTLDFIIKNKEKYHVDTNHINVMGFSAGGHLAASLCAYYKNEKFLNEYGISIPQSNIEHLVLCYPVITTEKEFTHEITCQKITQGREELKQFYSIEKHITKDFPKSYIWITSEDEVVNNYNALSLAQALSKEHVLYELHVLPIGGHGQSIAKEMACYNFEKDYQKKIEYNSKWINEAIYFIKNY